MRSLECAADGVKLGVRLIGCLARTIRNLIQLHRQPRNRRFEVGMALRSCTEALVRFSELSNDASAKGFER